MYSPCVEDARVRVADEIGGDKRVFSVVEDTLVCGLGGLLNGSLDRVIRSRLLEADNQIDNGDIDGRYTECHAAVNVGMSKDQVVYHTKPT